MDSSIVVSQADKILKIRLNRPDKKNALTQAMYQTLADTINSANTDDGVRVLHLSAEGDTFCAGNDLEDFLNNPSVDASSSVFQFMQAMVNAKKPVICAVNGQAVGIGATMLLHCDLVYAATDSVIKMPFAHLGVCPEFGASLLFPVLFGKQAASKYVLCGQPIDASTAQEIGLITQMTSEQTLVDTADAAALALAKQPPQATMATKQLMQQALQPQLNEALAREAEKFTELLQQDEAKQIISSFFQG